MKIKFKSQAIQNDEPINVEFETDAEYEIFYDDENDLNYHTYHFKEPKTNQANRVEINEKQVNIFAGPTTLIIKKDERYSNSYIQVNGQEFSLITELLGINIQDQIKTFKYKLFSANEDLMGEFVVSIEHV
ncbi:hypothetical protein MCSF7_01039 [Mycoplasmopsis columbina SF7]|uniref:DUF1934 domain-containing protein n=1 Tax=Mycoplasmopsis columbina SF7 TaxID=1037410 RepID=F9UK01_9BACT|nr:hypothetical protein [Mycoplasmopsis columbina]EGV00347.1 hypothetical protein MCSF7_01039 [Mycoplasmopsis columbina SF7]